MIPGEKENILEVNRERNNREYLRLPFGSNNLFKGINLDAAKYMILYPSKFFY
jgi:hypothetical protein